MYYSSTILHYKSNSVLCTTALQYFTTKLFQCYVKLCKFLSNTFNMLAESFHCVFWCTDQPQKFQHYSSTASLSKFAIKYTMGITMGNEPKNRITICDGPRANLRPLFNSNVTQVSVIKWSQN